MKFKRAISAIAALTMSVSCFAGLNISAKADEEVWSYDQVLYGTKTSASEASAQTTFTEEDGTIGTLESAYTIGSHTYAEGTVLQLATGEKNFSAPITGGKVHFSFTMTAVPGAYNNVQLVSSDGTVLLSSYPKITGKNNWPSATIVTICGQDVNQYIYQGITNTTWIDVSVDFDLDKNEVAYTTYAVTNGSGGTPNTSASATGTIEYDFTDKDIKGAKFTETAEKTVNLDNIFLYNQTSNMAKYSYSLNYTLGSGAEKQTIKTTAAKATAGTEITTETSFFVDGIKYFAISDGTTDFTTAQTYTVQNNLSDNMLNVHEIPLRVANQYDVKVNAIGDVTQSIVDEKVYEGEDYTVTAPRYIYDENAKVLYFASNPMYTGKNEGQNNNYYGYFISSISENYSKNITYNKKFENVVAFVDFDGSTGNNAGIRASNGSALDNSGYTSTVDIPAGTYTIEIYAYNRGRGSSVKIGDQTIATETDFSGSWDYSTFSNVVVETGGKLSLAKGGNNTIGCYDTIVVAGQPTLSSSAVTENVPDVTVTTAVTQNAPEFGTIQTSLISVTKTYGVSVQYPTTGTTPKLYVNGTEVENPGWTAVKNASTLISTYYVQFKAASEDEFVKFGTVKAAYGEQEVTLDLTSSGS